MEDRSPARAQIVYKQKWEMRFNPLWVFIYNEFQHIFSVQTHTHKQTQLLIRLMISKLKTTIHRPKQFLLKSKT